MRGRVQLLGRSDVIVATNEQLEAELRLAVARKDAVRVIAIEHEKMRHRRTEERKAAFARREMLAVLLASLLLGWVLDVGFHLPFDVAFTAPIALISVWMASVDLRTGVVQGPGLFTCRRSEQPVMYWLTLPLKLLPVGFLVMVLQSE